MKNGGNDLIDNPYWFFDHFRTRNIRQRRSTRPKLWIIYDISSSGGNPRSGASTNDDNLSIVNNKLFEPSTVFHELGHSFYEMGHSMDSNKNRHGNGHSGDKKI